MMRFLDSVYLPAHPGLSPSSLTQMRYAVVLYGRFLGHPPGLLDLDEQRIRAFLLAYSNTRRPATVNAKRRLLLAIWRCAYEEEAVPALPHKRIRRLPEDLPAPQAWTVEEIGLILSQAKRLAGMVCGLPAAEYWLSELLVTYDCGGRIGAISQVRCRDLLLEQRIICLRADWQKTGRELLYELATETVDACRSIWQPGRLLMWPQPYSREYRDRFFREKILRPAGVSFGRGRGGCWHKLRRTSGSLVEASGGDGAKHLGNTRKIFERHYRDPRICGAGQLSRLPRPIF